MLDGHLRCHHFQSRQSSGDELDISQTAIGTLCRISLAVPGARETANYRLALLWPKLDSFLSSTEQPTVVAVAVFTTSLVDDDYEVRTLKGNVEQVDFPPDAPVV